MLTSDIALFYFITTPLLPKNKTEFADREEKTIKVSLIRNRLRIIF